MKLSFIEKLLYRLLESFELSTAGFLDSWYRAGQIHEHGILREHSLRKAAECYAKATNDYRANFRLATMSENGEGVVKDYSLSAKLYKLVIDSGYSLELEYAINNLAVLYKYGYGVDKDILESNRLLDLSLSKYHNPCSLLNIKYFDSEDVLRCPQDIKESIEICMKLADQGDREVQFHLAHIYEYGMYSVTKSEAKYYELLSKAADSGHKEAMSWLEVKTERNLKAERDAKTIQDAKQGNAVAQYDLAVMCLHFRHNGRGEAGELSRLTMKSAKQGYVKAQYLLGLLYEGGYYVPEDSTRISGLVHGPMPKDIPENFEPAPGSLFFMEKGAPPNYKKAIEWYVLAAKQGHENARLRLKSLDDSINICAEVPPLNDLEIVKGLNQHGVFTIWHMTHKDNIEEIINSGLLSHTLAYKTTQPKDISDHDVQKWRESNDPIYDRKLHDYVPTYINIRNPMLYVKREIQNELCLIEISLSVLTDDNYIFSDGNAASQNTNFYHRPEDLEKLPWEILDAFYWNDFEDGKRKKCTEILIYPLIEPKFIRKIHCFSTETVEYISKFNVQSQVTGELFFGDQMSCTESSHFNEEIPF